MWHNQSGWGWDTEKKKIKCLERKTIYKRVGTPIWILYDADLNEMLFLYKTQDRQQRHVQKHMSEMNI